MEAAYSGVWDKDVSDKISYGVDDTDAGVLMVMVTLPLMVREVWWKKGNDGSADGGFKVEKKEVVGHVYIHQVDAPGR